jgi:ubiquinone/menaquinone biosynthesis C-methylase UbiE
MPGKLRKLAKNPVNVLKRQYVRRVQNRVRFSVSEVAGFNIPITCSNLYKETKQLNEALGNYHAEKSLEVGAGYGRLTPWIKDYSTTHYAIEPEAELFETAKELNPNIKFYKAKVQKLPFADSTFDLVVTWTVLQHVPPVNLRQAVNEIKRVSKPNAVILLTEAIGDKASSSYWEHSLEEWKDLLHPWKLVWSKDRQADKGLIMRFEQALPVKSS